MTQHQHLTKSILVSKYGYDKLISMLKDEFAPFTDDYIQFKNVRYSDGAVIFEFLAINENMIKEISEVEVTNDISIQQNIYRKYADKFYSQLLQYLTSQVDIVKKELEEKNKDVKYTSSTSYVSMFRYLKRTQILRLEVLL